MTEKEEKQIMNILENDNPYIYLGAGFSYGAQRDNGEKIPLGEGVKKKVLEQIKLLNNATYEEEKDNKLQSVCEALKQLDSKIYLNTLTEMFENFLPAGFHNYIVDYKWQSIFTVNIDDVVEKVYKNSHNLLDVFFKAKNENKVREKYQKLIKLHGCITAKDCGYVFATSEYDSLIANSTTDFRVGSLIQAFNSNSIFIVGTEFDEPEIRFFNAIFRNECIKFEAVFINPKPTQQLLRLVERHDNFSIIKIEAEEFLKYIHDHKDVVGKNYHALKSKLKRYGLYTTELVRENFQKKEDDYKTQLYFGEEPSWEDIIYDYPAMYSGITKFQEAIINNGAYRVFVIIGALYSGKTTILKQVFFNLDKNKNRSWQCFYGMAGEVNYDNIKKAIKELSSNIEKIIIFFDEVGEYYSVFNNILQLDERIVLVVSSYEKIHSRKKYALPSNLFCEYQVPQKLSDEDIVAVRKKLDEKGLSGKLFKKDMAEWKKVINKSENIVSAMYAITGNEKFQEYFEKVLKENNVQNENYFNVLLLGAALYKLGIPNIRQELLIKSKIGINKEMLLVLSDYIKESNGGAIRIKNKFIAEAIINSCLDKKFLVNCIIEICSSIVCYVDEKERNYYKNVYEYLTKYKYLKRNLRINDFDISQIYTSLKLIYEHLSYYWLQRGILEQQSGNFDYALQYFNTALEKNPKSYAIQHAIARNYCKSALKKENFSQAIWIFNEGIRRLDTIIETKEFLQSKFYSIHSRIMETINFYKEFYRQIPEEEDKKCQNLLNEISRQSSHDKIMSDLQYKYFCFKSEQKANFDKFYSNYEEDLDE